MGEKGLKKLLVLVCFLLLLGCSYSNEELSFTAFKNYYLVENSNLDKNQLLKNDGNEKLKVIYKQVYIQIDEKLTLLEGEITGLLHKFEFILEDKWQLQLADKKQEITVIIDEIYDLSPPSEWEGFHSLLIRMALEYDRTISLYQQYSNNKKLSYLQGSYTSLQRGAEQRSYLRELIMSDSIPTKVQWNTNSKFNALY